MFATKGAASRLAARLKTAVLAALFTADVRSNLRASGKLDSLFTGPPVVPLGGYGRETKGPVPRHPFWPMNHYATTWNPSARHGAQECARRVRQIARGQLTKANGLVA